MTSSGARTGATDALCRARRLITAAGLPALLTTTLLLPAAPAALAQAEPASAAPYQDRVIEGLPPDDTDRAAAEPPPDTTGPPRFLRLETRLGTQPFASSLDSDRRSRAGLAIFGLIDTPNHGTLSVDGTLSADGGGGSFTLRQRGLPLGGGWQAQHELGVIQTLAPAITRLPSRVFVPSSVVQGISAEWDHLAQGLQLQAGSGEPGRLEGLPSSRFVRLGGRRDTLAAQWTLPGSGEVQPLYPLRGWTLALQHESAHQVSADDLAARRTDARSNLLALRHESADMRVQGQAVSTQASDRDGTRSGHWIDAEWDEGPRQHGLAYYRLAPDLSWAQQALPSDLEGLNLRSQWRTRQWSAEGSVDWLRTLSGRAGAGRYATGSARWRLARGASLGAGASVRRFDGDAWSAYGDGRWPNAWGTAGLRLDLGGGDTEARSERLGYDQDWAVPVGWSLSTSLGLGQQGAQARTGEPAQRFWSAAMSWAMPVSPYAELRGNLDTERSSVGNRQWGLNLGGQWRLNSRWSLEGSFNRNTGRSVTRSSLDPLAPPVTLLATSADRSFYAVLRYEQQAGSRSAPLGGRPQEGGGRIEGVVFFDANRSGTQEASEQGVPGVTVFLDNRYAVRTDAQGRFEFPLVATGTRTVTVRNDTLPLPWSVVDDGSVPTTVRLREDTRLSIPVQRAE